MSDDINLRRYNKNRIPKTDAICPKKAKVIDEIVKRTEPKEIPRREPGPGKARAKACPDPAHDDGEYVEFESPEELHRYLEAVGELYEIDPKEIH